MTTERVSTRHGNPGAHQIVRFELTEVLKPDKTATAKIVAWDADGSQWRTLDDANISKFIVHSTFFRSFGFTGERGWAIRKRDSRKWEVISMEGSLVRTATASAVITAGASGNVTITDGTHSVTVTATNWGQNSTAISDRIAIFYDPSQEKWFIIGGGTGGDEGAIVTVYGGTANGECLWPGKVAAPNASATSHCSDEFPNGIDCLIVVLNSDIGSFGSKEALTVGEHYLARHVGDYDNGDDTFTPVYAIRTGKDAPQKVIPFELIYRLRFGVNTVAANALLSDPPGTEEIKVFDPSPSIRTWEGPVGATGWARKTNVAGEYDIIWMENTARGIAFVMSNPDLTHFTIEGNYQGLQSDLATLTLFDEAGLFPRRQEGAHGVAFYDPNFERYIPLNMETQAGWVAGALDAPMDLNAANVAAAVNTYSGTQQDIQAPPDLAVSVYQLFFGHALTDADFIGVYDAVVGKYAPVVVDQKALLIECKAYNSFGSSDVTVEVFEVRRLTPFPFSGVAVITDVNNPFGFAATDGTLLLCCYDEFAKRYEIIGTIPAGIGQGIVLSDQDGYPYRKVKVSGLGYPLIEAINAGGVAFEIGNTPLLIESVHDDKLYALKTEPNFFVYSGFGGLAAFACYPIAGMIDTLLHGVPVISATPVATSHDFNNGLTVLKDSKLTPVFVPGGAQPGPIVYGLIGSVAAPVINDGAMWGPQPSSPGFMAKGYPGYSAIGPTAAAYAPEAASHPYAFRAETVAILLVALNSDVTDKQETDDYEILVGDLGLENNGGWSNKPFALNRCGRTIVANEYCLALRCPSGWHFVPLITSGAQHVVKTTTNHAPGTAHTVNKWDGWANVISDPLQTFEAMNRTSTTMAPDSYGLIDFIDGHWYLEPWECVPITL